MKQTFSSHEREKIVADAISPVATELRLLDAGDLVSLLHYERYGNLADLVSSAAELYFHPDTVQLGVGGEYKLEWDSEPLVTLDLEIKPPGVTIYAKLSLAKDHAAVQIDHIAFQRPQNDADENTAFLLQSLEKAKFHAYPRALAG